MIKTAHRKKKHFWEYLLINIFVFFGIFLLSFIVLNVSLFDSFTQAFRDFTLTDLYYSKIVKQDKIYNGPLVVINLEHRNRTEIAYLLDKLETGAPKVIGIDAVFAERKDSADSSLQQVLSQHNNIIIPYIANFDSSIAETKNDPYFKTGSAAYVNVMGEQDNYTTIRSYIPVYNSIPAFTTAVVQKYDPALTASLFKNQDKNKEIRYYGNQQNFVYHNYDDVMDPAFNPHTLTGKIILIGYMGVPGSGKNSLDEDRFFTPLNPRLSGRSLPDMYGVIIQANIIRMVLDKDYLFVFPSWLNFCLAFFLSWLLMPLFVRWYVHKALWFSLFTMIFQMAISILFLFFTLWLYANANLKVESSAVLVSVLLIGNFLSFYHHLIKFLKYRLKWNFTSKLFESAH